VTASAEDAAEQRDGGGAATRPRRRRRAVGPAGAPSPAVDGPEPAWSAQPDATEDDDERLLREVPPHHGG